jgi:hypothetical protein
MVQLSVQEYDVLTPRGAPRIFTNTLAIDTSPPPNVSDLIFTEGSSAISDTLSWTPPTGDTSPGGGVWQVHCCRSTLGLTTAHLRSFATTHTRCRPCSDQSDGDRAAAPGNCDRGHRGNRDRRRRRDVHVGIGRVAVRARLSLLMVGYDVVLLFMGDIPRHGWGRRVRELRFIGLQEAASVVIG